MRRVAAVASFAFLVAFAVHAVSINGELPLGTNAAGIVDEIGDYWQIPDIRCAQQVAEDTIYFIKDQCEANVPGCHPCASLRFAVTGDGTIDSTLDFELDVTYDAAFDRFTTLLDIRPDGQPLSPIDVSTDGNYVFGQVSVTSISHLSPTDCALSTTPGPPTESVPAMGEWGWLVLGAAILACGVTLIVRRDRPAG